MKKRLIFALSLSMTLGLYGLILTGCATHSDSTPVLVPPPPGPAHDQTTGVHRAHSPLFKKDLKN